jgi:tripartite-type tricarboxylate transporter receptor subunit TctC
MRRFLLALAFALSSTTAFSSTLTIVTTAGSGSLSDQVARFIQPLLAKELGVDVVVANAPGGNGVVGLRAFNQLSGDHLLIGSFAVPFVAKTLPQKEFDPLVDFSPVMGLTHTPLNITVPANSPARDMASLAKLSKEKGGLKGGTAHPSTSISMALIDKTFGATTEPINYKQTAQLYTELAAGLLDYTVGGGNSVSVGLVQSGHLRNIARADQVGIPDFAWTALFVKADNENSPLANTARKVINAESMRGLPQPFLKADAPTIRAQVQREFALIPAP